jgi:V/A-type H+-transporting ATPase subunit K
MEFLSNCGTQIAFFGAALSVALACAGSGRGVGLVGEAATGVLSEDPGKFSQCLILQIIPGTQGLYGLVIWFFAMSQMHFFESGFFVNGVIANPLSIEQGLAFAAACLIMGIGGMITAIAQGRCAAAGIALIAKRPEEMSKAMILAIMVEFYAILCLLASFLMLNSMKV